MWMLLMFSFKEEARRPLLHVILPLDQLQELPLATNNAHESTAYSCKSTKSLQPKVVCAATLCYAEIGDEMHGTAFQGTTSHFLRGLFHLCRGI